MSFPLTINSLNFQCDTYHSTFWESVSKGRWEPQTFKILSEFLKPDSVYCDIGAWIGPTVIYAARKCKQVYCFEPDIAAYPFLLWNIHLNRFQNVIPFNIALADCDGIRKISSFGKLGDSRTSLLNPKNDEGINVLCLQWKSWMKIAQPEKIDFIKIDIEGGEFDFLPSIKEYLVQYKPILYLSTHREFLPKNCRKEVMQRLIGVLNIYKKCYNEKLELVEPVILLNREALNGRTYLLLF